MRGSGGATEFSRTQSGTRKFERWLWIRSLILFNVLFCFQDECKKWIPLIIPKFRFVAGRHRGTAGAIVYITIVHAETNFDTMVLKCGQWCIHCTCGHSEYYTWITRPGNQALNQLYLVSSLYTFQIVLPSPLASKWKRMRKITALSNRNCFTGKLFALLNSRGQRCSCWPFLGNRLAFVRHIPIQSVNVCRVRHPLSGAGGTNRNKKELGSLLSQECGAWGWGRAFIY